jgi:hypothetical protein
VQPLRPTNLRLVLLPLEHLLEPVPRVIQLQLTHNEQSTDAGQPLHTRPNQRRWPDGGLAGLTSGR